MDDTIILQDNLTFLFLCEDIILSKRKLYGTNIRQEGYVTAPLGAYLSFWKSGLPYSVDVNGNPLTSISKEGCRAYNLETGCIEPTSADFQIEMILEKFNEYRKNFNRSHNDPTLLDVMVILQDQLEEGLEPNPIYLWDSFRYKCRIASLEAKLSNIKSENAELEMIIRTQEEDAFKLLTAYSTTIQEGEEDYNRSFDNCIKNIETYRTALRKLKFNRLHYGVSAVMDCTEDKAYKDAVKYWQYRLRTLFTFQFRSLPEAIKSLPIETINKICNTDLKSYNTFAKRKI